jgi:hypothetical protein
LPGIRPKRFMDAKYTTGPRRCPDRRTRPRVLRGVYGIGAHQSLRACAVRKGLYTSPYGDGRIPAYGGDRAIRLYLLPGKPDKRIPLLSLARKKAEEFTTKEHRPLAGGGLLAQPGD